ncbi:FlgO family outer membrane protein [Desulfobaculum senezii]
MKRHVILAAALSILVATPPVHAEDKTPTPGEQMLASSGQHTLGPGSGVTSKFGGVIHKNGETHGLRNQGTIHPGVLVSDGKDGYIWLHSNDPMSAPPEHMAAAQELRLKIRELAAQLLADGPDLGGAVTIPVSFVNQDNFMRTSSFGRFVAEQMFHELSRRGIPVREYRTMPTVATYPANGEFVLTRDMERAAPQVQPGLVLAGTYYFDENSLFVNARLFRPTDGVVARTASALIQQTPLTKAMLAKSAARQLRTAETEMRSYDEMKDKTSLGFMLEQDDLH